MFLKNLAIDESRKLVVLKSIDDPLIYDDDDDDDDESYIHSAIFR